MATDDPIFLRDEVLRLLYWMRGEGLGEDVAEEQIARFLVADREAVASAVGWLTRSGHLVKIESDPTKLRLSALGISEGGRRFSEEFSSVLGHEDHLVCDDPDCECHQPDFAGVCQRVG